MWADRNFPHELGRRKCEKQVAIAFNSSQLKRSQAVRRNEAYTKLLEATGANDIDLIPAVQESEDEDEEEEEQDEFRVGEQPDLVLDAYVGEQFNEVVMQEGV